MNGISAVYAIGHDGPKLVWQIINTHFLPADPGFRVSFWLIVPISKKEAVRSVERSLNKDGVDWLVNKGQRWIFDAAKFRAWLPTTGIEEAKRQELLTSIEWLNGVVVVEPDVAPEIMPTRDPQPRISTHVEFDIYREEFLVDRKTKIFLSHQGADKPMARRFFTTLKLLGLIRGLTKTPCRAGPSFTGASWKG